MVEKRIMAYVALVWWSKTQQITSLIRLSKTCLFWTNGKNATSLLCDVGGRAVYFTKLMTGNVLYKRTYHPTKRYFFNT